MAEKSIDILSPRALEQVAQLIKEAKAARPSLSPDQRRKRPVGEGGGGVAVANRVLIGQITGGIPGNQPVYSARAIDSPEVTVTNQRPFMRPFDGSVKMQAASLGDECFLFRDADEVWRLALVPETMATDDCESVAGSRNNMLYELIETTPTAALPITVDWIKADTTAGDITLTMPEEEVGKRVTVTHIGTGSNKVIITNTVNGIAGIDIIFKFDSPEFAWDGTEWSII